MADLLTHLATVYVPARLTVRSPALRSLVYVGVCLPDVLTRVGFPLRFLGRGIPIHDIVHTPLFMGVVAYAAALLFERSWRRGAFLALFLGGLAHLALDGAKDYLGEGSILWAYPLSLRRHEWGLYVPEHTVYFMAPALGLIFLARILSRRRKAASPSGDPPGGVQRPELPPT